jgi:hypothetical protein
LLTWPRHFAERESLVWSSPLEVAPRQETVAVFVEGPLLAPGIL